ncbi:hypothetical protein Poly21_35900 [Allorhodopirellula heiligendammensis]|uniref:Uncharacterized protein n=1 Tax=Allorhodopirellula heiligendammensis TaxID=2714739 RepID=A0A5C6BEX2_9BACT|nr:hypothetical protein Poly21_53740 [Allorhodopirellula heiligendammensis]TWU16385.1 hypothetical protein Poly21_35900 [Allorhodopirellula heiligendammensis]
MRWRQTILFNAYAVTFRRTTLHDGLLQKQFNLIELLWFGCCAISTFPNPTTATDFSYATEVSLNDPIATNHGIFQI